MKFIGIIPARYGSSRLEGKPLADIEGKSMIQRVYEQAKKALNEVFVATDDQRIYDHVEHFGGNAIMTSTEHSTGTNRCLEAYEKLDIQADVVINIQGDEPLLVPNQLNELQSCFDDGEVEIATLAIKAKPSEELTDGKGVYVILDNQSFALYFSRSVLPHQRDAEKASWNQHHLYYKHVGLYAYTVKALKEFATMSRTSLEKMESLEQLRWLQNGRKIKVGITAYDTIAIDTSDDLDKVRQLLKSGNIEK